MSLSNFERMLQLADSVFSVKNDPNQLDVNEVVIQRLIEIHPASVQEFDEGEGPVAWILIFPTTDALMLKFLSQKISEKELFEMTPLNAIYDAIYLCSAMVLDEYRRKGISKRLSIDAIKQIQEYHPIKNLFYWPFTTEGELCANAIAAECNLPLLKPEQE